jgi:UDP-3-O-[3-hydroxymyristoyl] glucosamine N-acyltransferase
MDEIVSQPIRLRDLAALLGREYQGDPDLEIRSVASLEDAGPADLAFVRSEKLLDRARASEAGALIVPPGLDLGARATIESPDPGLDFARAAKKVCAAERPLPGVHPAASVDAAASVDPRASIGAGAVVEAGARIGAETVVEANAVIEAGVQIGAACRLAAGSVVRHGCVLGDRVVVQAGAVIGSDGFGFVKNPEGAFEAAPQLGSVVLEDDVEIGANSTIDRGSLGPTRIRRGAKIDNLVHVAHNCEVGEDVVIAAQTGLSGSTFVGAGAMLMGQVGASGHLRIGAGAFVGPRSGLHRDVKDGARVWGSPQMDEKNWHRSAASLARLPGIFARVRALERKLGLRETRDGEEE